MSNQKDGFIGSGGLDELVETSWAGTRIRGLPTSERLAERETTGEGQMTKVNASIAATNM